MKSNIPNEPASRLLQTVFLGLLVFKIACQPVQAADTNEAVLRLTVELRDGSRVVGQIKAIYDEVNPSSLSSH